MAKSTDGQGHKDKYLDTSRKILSQEMFMCNMKALELTVQKLLEQIIFVCAMQHEYNFLT